jgi:hypothetical protein
MMSDMFLNQLNDIRYMRCISIEMNSPILARRAFISIEKEMYEILFVHRTLIVKALRAIFRSLCNVSMDINALTGKN